MPQTCEIGLSHSMYIVDNSVQIEYPFPSIGINRGHGHSATFLNILFTCLFLLNTPHRLSVC